MVVDPAVHADAMDMQLAPTEHGAASHRGDVSEGHLAEASLAAEHPDTRWRRRFEAVQGRHASVRTVDVADLGPLGGRRRALGRSLATFQLGESGSGEHLFAAAVGSDVSADHLAALRCFVAEEQEHARLLALVLDGLRVPCRDHHWTDGIFVRLRRAHTLRSEVLTLLVAEVIALSYYGALRDGVGHPALRDIFGRIHADEVRHVDFHAETLPPYLRRFGPLGQRLVRVVWNILVTGAAVVVAADHGGALAAAGLTRRRFVRSVHRDRRDLSRRLFSRVA
jgi:hypothetical protein